jgi:energy-converting hydrogenase Eha subunit C
MLGIARRRSVDYVAVISLVEISIGMVVTLAAANVRLALVARALQGALTGLFFLATVPIGHPIIYHMARQFVASAAPEIASGFERAHQLDHGRTFRLLTVAWGIATILISFVNVGFATTVAPATYLFAAPVVGIGSNVALIVWTMRYSSRRFMRFHSA